MLYVGIDASLKSLAVCAVSQDGTVIEEATIANAREPLDQWLLAIADDEELLCRPTLCGNSAQGNVLLGFLRLPQLAEA